MMTGGKGIDWKKHAKKWAAAEKVVTKNASAKGFKRSYKYTAAKGA